MFRRSNASSSIPHVDRAGLFLAHFVNRNRDRLFADSQIEYSNRAIELVGRSTTSSSLPTAPPVEHDPRITDPTHRIVLRAAPGMTPTMDAHATTDGSRGRVDNNLTLRIVPNYVVIQGLRFTNTNLAADIAHQEVMVRLDGSSSVVDGNFFDGNGRTPTPTDIFLVICNAARDNVISGNRFDYSGGKSLIHITASCGEGFRASTLFATTACRDSETIRKRSARRSSSAGHAARSRGTTRSWRTTRSTTNGGGCYGLLDTNTSSLTVRNNIFAKITRHRYAVGCNVATGRSSGVAYDSVMFGNTHDAESDCASGGWTLSTSYTDDPSFVDTAATPPDLHLASTTGSRRNGGSTWTSDSHCSAAIDRASVTDSFDLEPSPNGGRRNLGAYGNTPEASKSCRLDSGVVLGVPFDWITR
jgi:hypothetical protein